MSLLCGREVFGFSLNAGASFSSRTGNNEAGISGFSSADCSVPAGVQVRIISITLIRSGVPMSSHIT